jgi:hypothetical protein
MKTVNFPKGDPGNPLTYKAELGEKLFSLAERSAPQDHVHTLADKIENLVQVTHVRNSPLYAAFRTVVFS